MDAVERTFGANLRNDKETKSFNFLPLKIVLSQFLSSERLGPRQVAEMSPFEHLLLRTYLIRFGYLTKTQQVDLAGQDIRALLKARCKRNSERQMLELVFKMVFKKLRHPFSESSRGKPYHSDMSPISLSAQENTRFYSHYFGNLLTEETPLEHFFVTEQILSDSALMVDYIAKIKASGLITRDIFKFVSKSGTTVDADNWDMQRYSIKGSQLFRRYKYRTADLVNKRLTNYEIVLNQFDPEKERDTLLRWMGIILRDLRLNPTVKIPCNVYELDEAVRLFLNYWVKPD